MPDHDDAPGQNGRIADEQDRDVDRLERALERIAASAHRAADAPDAAAGAIMDRAPMREVAARLDALILQLRHALARD